MRRIGTMIAFAVGLWTEAALANYADECINEDCDEEEVRELYSSYDSECLDEECSREEVIELAGGPQHVNKLLDEFRQRGWRVLESDASQCQPTGTKTRCVGVVMFCQDWYQCPTGTDSCAPSDFSCPGGNTSSSFYACGGCFGLPW